MLEIIYHVYLLTLYIIQGDQIYIKVKNLAIARYAINKRKIFKEKVRKGQQKNLGLYIHLFKKIYIFFYVFSLIDPNGEHD